MILKKNLKENLFFIVPFIIWLIIGAGILASISKGDLVLFFNENRMLVANFYFIIASKFAEYSFIIFFIFILLNQSFGNAFMAALTWLASGIGAQSLKRLFDMPRPAAFFGESNLNKIGNTELHYAYSFPSGHSTTAFALFFIFGFFVKNKKWQILFFILALSTAISRMYLLQHFFIDVYFGSILGVLIATIVFVSINSSNIFGFQNWKHKKLGLKRLF